MSTFRIRNGKDALSKTCLDICTYNVNTLWEHHMDNFLAELELNGTNSLKWDIIGLSETKLKSCYTEVTHGNHILFNSGVQEDEIRKYGVGFLVKDLHSNSILEFNGISERLCYIRVKCKFNNATFIQIYAPTTAHSDEEVEQFYDQLQSVTDKVPNRDTLFIMGDFNSKVGDIDCPDVVGRHSNVKRGSNPRGERLVAFCLQNGLFITNTFFKHRSKWTWMSPGDRVRNTVDYILTRRSTQHHVQDSGVISHPDISDHRMVRCKSLLTFNKRHKSCIKPTLKFNTKKLKDDVVKELFAEKVADNLNKYHSKDSNATALFENIQQSLLDASENVLGIRKPTKPEDWITDETLQAITRKRNIRRILE